MRNARRAPLLALLLMAVTIAPAAAQSRDMDSYLLFALQGMRTKGLSVSSGNIGVNDPNGAISSARGVIDAPQSDSWPAWSAPPCAPVAGASTRTPSPTRCRAVSCPGTSAPSRFPS